MASADTHWSLFSRLNEDSGEQDAAAAARRWKPAANISQAKAAKEGSQVGPGPAPRPAHTPCSRHINIHQDVKGSPLL